MKRNDRPLNFLVFVMDQVGAHSFPFYGNPDTSMANLTRLAEQGVICERAYCNNPVCMPSRATLLTGLTPRQHGCVTNGVPLPESVPTVSGLLSKEGYRTFAAGKLHLQPGLDGGGRGPLPEFSWEDKVRWERGEIDGLPGGYYGFERTAYANGHVNGCYGDYVNETARSCPEVLDAYRPSEGRPTCPGNAICWRTNVPAEKHYNHWIADSTIAFMESVPEDQPFFVWCSFPDPHGPWAAAAPYADRFEPSRLRLNSTWRESTDPLPLLERYRQGLPGFLRAEDQQTLAEVTAQTYGMLEHVDHNVGRVMDALDASGRRGDTVVVVLADHGEYLGSHGLLGKTPWPYEELLRIPMVWLLPERAGGNGGRSLSIPVSTLDFVPTVLELAGQPADALFCRGRARADFRLPGDSLAPWLTGATPPDDRAVCVEFDNGMKAGPPIRMRALVDRNRKLTVYDGEPGGLLYDLESDPHEMRNLWNEPGGEAVRVRMVDTLMRQMIRSDPLTLPRYIGA